MIDWTVRYYLIMNIMEMFTGDRSLMEMWVQVKLLEGTSIYFY